MGHLNALGNRTTRLYFSENAPILRLDAPRSLEGAILRPGFIASGAFDLVISPLWGLVAPFIVPEWPHATRYHQAVVVRIVVAIIRGFSGRIIPGAVPPIAPVGRLAPALLECPGASIRGGNTGNDDTFAPTW